MYILDHCRHFYWYLRWKATVLPVTATFSHRHHWMQDVYQWTLRELLLLTCERWPMSRKAKVGYFADLYALTDQHSHRNYLKNMGHLVPLVQDTLYLLDNQIFAEQLL